MKTGAIICEYNPLHNGHVYHIQETKNYGVTHVIAILSDNFVQRGDVALLHKFDRAKLALQAGADLVLELPVIFSCASAETYATGAVALLNQLGIIDRLSFGSSNGNTELLTQLAENMYSVTENNKQEIQNCIKTGNSYPSAVCKIYKACYGEKQADLLQDANNLLAIEYIKAMKKVNADWELFTIPRQCVMHDSLETSSRFASASFIRNAILEQQENYLHFIPPETAELLNQRLQEGRIASMNYLESVALYKMRMISESELLNLPDMTPALARRFLNARTANSFSEFLACVKTKCFTMARIRRIIMCAMIGIEKQDLQLQQPYARILAFNQKGSELLGILKKTSKIPLGTSLKKLANLSPQAARLAQIETNASQVYGLAQKTITSAEQEFRTNIRLEAVNYDK